jgi:hypothetical protein
MILFSILYRFNFGFDLGAGWLTAEDIRRELSTAVHENVQLVHNPPEFIYHQLVDFGLPPVCLLFCVIFFNFRN